MRSPFFRFTLAVLAAALSACGPGAEVPAGPSSAATPLHARATRGYATIYNFGSSGPYDAQGYRATLFPWNGALYGTSYGGGAKGQGTIYSVTPQGSEKLVYSFGETTNDGAQPFWGASLIAAGKALYGTTTSGGRYGGGTVYALDASGRERVVCDFGKNALSGIHPEGSLLYLGGKLYGTFYNSSQIFVTTPAGRASTLYDFTGPYKPGGSRAGLVAIGTTLYGTTESGGVHGDGTVYSVTLPHSGKIVLNFIDGFNGQDPEWGLALGNGVLYGTAGGGNGAAFGVLPSGRRVMFHQFTSQDGSDPQLLTYANGTLYGTALQGGAHGFGTLFSIDTAGRVKVLHDFQGGADGAYPQGGVAYENGRLYGTTSSGGSENLGVVYAYTL